MGGKKILWDGSRRLTYRSQLIIIQEKNIEKP